MKQSAEKGKEKSMDRFEPITDAELGELQNAQPDDSISISRNEGVSPQEAAKNVEILDKKVGSMDRDEQAFYEGMQQIADKGGVLIDDLKPGNGPFLNDQDMMKKEVE